MDKFNQIIKKKVEQFDIPFNDAHWQEMEGKLNAIRAAKIKNSIIGMSVIITLSVLLVIFYNTSKQEANTKSIAAHKEQTFVANEAIQQYENLTDSKKINSLAVEKNTEKQATKTNNSTTVNQEGETVKRQENEVLNTQQKNERNNNTETKEKIDLKISAEFIVYNNRVCYGEKVSFEAIENNKLFTYYWDFGDGINSSEINPSHIYNNSGTYTVSLELTNTKTNQKTTKVQKNIVRILPTPNVSINYSEVSDLHEGNKLLYPYTTFAITNNSKAFSSVWDFGNGEKSTLNNSKTSYKKAGEYNVKLIVKDKNTACTQTINKQITINNGFDLFAQNAIKPNSTIPENKVFIPGALLGWDVKFEMVILNKSGKTIYTTSDKNEPWNGRLNNLGKILKNDVYLWQIKTFDAEENIHYHHGKINLVN